MTEPRSDREATDLSPARATEPIRYPEDHVLAVVDDAEQLESAVAALRDAGFLASEVDVSCGRAAAKALESTTGRGGLTGLVIRIAERIGLTDEEMETKDGYERALHDGHFVVSVLAPTEERRMLAGRVLKEHRAHFIRFLGRLTIEVIAP